ncbi:flagellar motor protein MotD [Aliikangiella sp. G2MR2-5]|uniref:flagellar motor protein MotD n=1 Tax=Aliikangiella sp. G2MR2-5 TaxID=2788943 RepID=UPI0018A9B87D|nr:flagellar motor protein MotD [Aliikangiella sp. G2MR2-5]
MRRNKPNLMDEEQDTSRWLISYADFITLLFAFFVVMYSISQVNETKYKILSESLVQAFDTPVKSMKPIQIGEVNRSEALVSDNNEERPEIEAEKVESGEKQTENYASTEEFKELENGLRESLGDLIEQELADITSDENWININLRSGLLFPSGSDDLNDNAGPLMEEVSKHLNSNLQMILVHGHTDNIPIDTERFPSNWELSSARGVAVVRKLQNMGVQPSRMSVEGHGQFQPVASNDTPEGRAKNRRVVISISRKQRVDKVDEEPKVEPSAEEKTQEKPQKDVEPEFKVIRLPGGGILIRGKDLPEDKKDNADASKNNDSAESEN